MNKLDSNRRDQNDPVAETELFGTLNPDSEELKQPGSAPPPPEIPGFRILSMLGHGGMGCVYLAEHLELQRLIALKIVASGAAASPEMLSRFRDESRSVAAVSHPGVCQIFEVGESDGLPFLAMEYIEGQTLLELLRNQLPSAKEAARLAIDELSRGLGGFRS